MRVRRSCSNSGFANPVRIARLFALEPREHHCRDEHDGQQACQAKLPAAALWFGLGHLYFPNSNPIKSRVPGVLVNISSSPAANPAAMPWWQANALIRSKTWCLAGGNCVA